MNELTALLLDELKAGQGAPEMPNRRDLLIKASQTALAAGLAAAFGTSILAACARPEEDDRDPIDNYVSRPSLPEWNNKMIEIVKSKAALTDIQDLDQETQSLREEDVVKTLHNIFKGNEKYEELKDSLRTMEDWKMLMGIQIEGRGVWMATQNRQLKNQGDLTVYSEDRRMLIKVRKKDEAGSPVREVRIFLPNDTSNLPKEQLFFNHLTSFKCETDKAKYIKIGHWARAKFPNTHGLPPTPKSFAYDEALFEDGRARLEQAYEIDGAGRQVMGTVRKRKTRINPQTNTATLHGSSMDLN